MSFHMCTRSDIKSQWRQFCVSDAGDATAAATVVRKHKSQAYFRQLSLSDRWTLLLGGLMTDVSFVGLRMDFVAV